TNMKISTLNGISFISFFFFSSRRRHTRWPRDWSSDVCSSDLGWFPCRYWQLRRPPRSRLRSGTPPNLGGECPHSNSFTAPMTAENIAFRIAGGHRPPLQLYGMTSTVLPPDLKPEPRNPSQIIDFLENTKWADTLSHKEVEVLSGYFRLYTAEKGSVIVSEGSREIYLCLLVDGEVRIV